MCCWLGTCVGTCVIDNTVQISVIDTLQQSILAIAAAMRRLYREKYQTYTRPCHTSFKCCPLLLISNGSRSASCVRSLQQRHDAECKAHRADLKVAQS